MSPPCHDPLTPRARPSFLSALVAALFCFVVTSVAMPGDVLGATSAKAAMCGANLRTSDTTSAQGAGHDPEGHQGLGRGDRHRRELADDLRWEARPRAVLAAHQRDQRAKRPLDLSA